MSPLPAAAVPPRPAMLRTHRSPPHPPPLWSRSAPLVTCCFAASTPLRLTPSRASISLRVAHRPHHHCLPTHGAPQPNPPALRRRRHARFLPTALIPPGNLPRRLPRALETALIINAVPFLWGSYSAATKLITNISPTVPLPLVNLITTALSVGTLYFLTPPEEQGKKASFRTSAELGAYIFCGAYFHLRSIAFTSASRSAFFVQLTTVFIPLIEYVTGAQLSRSVLPACALVLMGAACLAVPTDPAMLAHPSSFLATLNVGDWLGIGSALFYSLYVIRLQAVTTKNGSPFAVTLGFTQMQLLFAMIMEGVDVFNGEAQYTYLLNHFSRFTSSDLLTLAVCVFWVGTLTSAVSNWAQAVGQQRVGASRAAIYYSTQPVWSVGLAIAAGVDRLSQLEIIGGLLIVAGGVLVAVMDSGHSTAE